MTCTLEWQPLLLLPKESLTVDGLACNLTVTKNVNGQQVTCNNHPLYINVKDLNLIATATDTHWQLVTSTAPLTEDPSSVKVTTGTDNPTSTPKATSTPLVEGTPKTTSA
jgi:hypothetical protein